MSAVCHPPLSLRRGRVHEACGPGAIGFAAATCAAGQGQILWIREGWRAESLNPVGLSAFFDPHRLLLAATANQTETLAVAEEALKDGAIPLVVLEITSALDLREGRRLQLASAAGRTTGLCLIPEGMGSNAAQTRWYFTSLAGTDRADSTPMRWALIKNKSGTLGTWDVRWDHAARRLDMVPPVGERPGSARAPG